MAPRRRAPRKGRKVRKAMRRMRVSRGMPRQQHASVKQLIELTASQTNTIQCFENISLKAFDRAAGVGRYYQFYRIKYVKVTFKPLYDTFGSQIATGSVPYLYYLIDNGYSFNQAFCSTFNSMRDAGAKPRRLDDKSVSVTFKPAVAISVADISGNTNSTPWSLVKKSPWLTTNGNASGQGVSGWTANGTDHRGLWFGVQQDVLQAGNQQMPYDISIECLFEFKKPLSFANPPGNPTPFKLIDLENPVNIKAN